MMCDRDELVDIVYNGYAVVVCKPAGDLCDLLEVLDDEILNSLVFKISDEYGKIRIHSTEDLDTVILLLIQRKTFLKMMNSTIY